MNDGHRMNNRQSCLFQPLALSFPMAFFPVCRLQCLHGTYSQSPAPGRLARTTPSNLLRRLTHSISSSVRIKAPSTLRCQIQGAIGCVSLVEKRFLNAGSDGGTQCNGANSSHFLPALPLLDCRRLSLRHPMFIASVR